MALDYFVLCWKAWCLCCVLQEVCQQIYATLYDYPCLKACPGLLEYVSHCVRIAWGLCVQRSPYTISYESQIFEDGVHARFHTSDPDSTDIKSYLWPALVDCQGVCVSRAVVITWWKANFMLICSLYLQTSCVDVGLAEWQCQAGRQNVRSFSHLQENATSRSASLIAWAAYGKWNDNYLVLIWLMGEVTEHFTPW